MGNFHAASNGGGPGAGGWRTIVPGPGTRGAGSGLGIHQIMPRQAERMEFPLLDVLVRFELEQHTLACVGLADDYA